MENREKKRKNRKGNNDENRGQYVIGSHLHIKLDRYIYGMIWIYMTFRSNEAGYFKDPFRIIQKLVFS